MKVSKWGNSLAVRLPQALVEALDLKEGDEIEITVAGTRDSEVSRDRKREEAFKRLRKLRGRRPAGLSSIGTKRMPGDISSTPMFWLYLLSDDMAKADRAEALLAAGGVISVQVLNEFASVATRKKGLIFPRREETLSTIRRACRVGHLMSIPTNCGLDIAEQLSLLDLMTAWIVAAALRAGCSTLFRGPANTGKQSNG